MALRIFRIVYSPIDPEYGKSFARILKQAQIRTHPIICNNYAQNDFIGNYINFKSLEK
jgi:hypothetical protein